MPEYIERSIAMSHHFLFDSEQEQQEFNDLVKQEAHRQYFYQNHLSIISIIISIIALIVAIFK